MKKSTLLLIILLASCTVFSQNKNMSFSIKYGGTHVIDNDVLGGQFSPQLSYHFLKNKQANLTASIFYTAYRLNYLFYRINYRPDGSSFLVKDYIPVSDKYWGLSISSQIKLLNLEKKLIPFIQPQILFHREMVNSNLIYANGSTPSPDMYFILNLTAGIQHNKRVQLSAYYEYALMDTKTASLATPNYAFGGKLSYLFNISFSKKEKVVEKE